MKLVRSIIHLYLAKFVEKRGLPALQRLTPCVRLSRRLCPDSAVQFGCRFPLERSDNLYRISRPCDGNKGKAALTTYISLALDVICLFSRII